MTDGGGGGTTGHCGARTGRPPPQDTRTPSHLLDNRTLLPAAEVLVRWADTSASHLVPARHRERYEEMIGD
jgi:hypothetical protein